NRGLAQHSVHEHRASSGSLRLARALVLTIRADPVGQDRSRRMTRPILEVRGLEVVFDGFRAIDGVDLTVNEGELRFLIGPNGAGKTTLIDVVTGLTKPTSGSVSYNGG